MTFAQLDFPKALPAQELDTYLERGWFRMAQTIFTTHFLNFKDQYYSAIWLRSELDQFTEDKTYRRLKKLNAAFSTEIQKAILDPEKEALYTRYKTAVTFQASPTLRQLLYGKAEEPIFDTYEINIRDGKKLVATGFFDLGESGAAGITCFYDPSYRKYSPGKYLIYLKMDHVRRQGIKYFYPGYFAPGYPYFDYKLSIGKTSLQFFEISSRQWLPLDSFSPAHSPLALMEQKLTALQKMLAQAKTDTSLLKYEFFDANLMPELKGAELFDFPVFLIFSDTVHSDFTHVIVYNILDRRYHIILCRSVWKIATPNIHKEMYALHILKELEDQVLAGDPAETAAWIMSRRV